MVARTDLATDPGLVEELLQARKGTAFFARKLNELTDAELDGGSLLPGWSRRHIVAHIGCNARALRCWWSGRPPGLRPRCKRRWRYGTRRSRSARH